MLAEPERTQYDLRFRFLGFPVRVHPFFWILTILFNGDSIVRNHGAEYLLIWVAVVFVSIMIHELGHALLFRRFGAGADIVLYAFGGLAIPTHAISGRWRRIFVALAGPVAGFIFCGIVYGSNEAFNWSKTEPHLGFLYRQLVWVNLGWGLFNLLPVFPLDGGQVSRELCGMWWGTRGKRISLKISFGVALLMVAYSLLCEFDANGNGKLLQDLPWWAKMGSFYTAILFGLLAFTSYQLLQQRDWADEHWADDRTSYDR